MDVGTKHFTSLLSEAEKAKQTPKSRRWLPHSQVPLSCNKQTALSGPRTSLIQKLAGKPNRGKQTSEGERPPPTPSYTKPPPRSTSHFRLHIRGTSGSPRRPWLRKSRCKRGPGSQMRHIPSGATAKSPGRNRRPGEQEKANGARQPGGGWWWGGEGGRSRAVQWSGAPRTEAQF